MAVVCRQICAPFTLALRHLQLKAGQLDTRLTIPDVDLAVTSRDFQAINDVIKVTGLASVCSLLLMEFARLAMALSAF